MSPLEMSFTAIQTIHYTTVNTDPLNVEVYTMHNDSRSLNMGIAFK